MPHSSSAPEVTFPEVVLRRWKQGTTSGGEPANSSVFLFSLLCFSLAPLLEILTPFLSFARSTCHRAVWSSFISKGVLTANDSGETVWLLQGLWETSQDTGFQGANGAPSAVFSGPQLWHSFITLLPWKCHFTWGHWYGRKSVILQSSSPPHTHPLGHLWIRSAAKYALGFGGFCCFLLALISSMFVCTKPLLITRWRTQHSQKRSLDQGESATRLYVHTSPHFFWTWEKRFPYVLSAICFSVRASGALLRIGGAVTYPAVLAWCVMTGGVCKPTWWWRGQLGSCWHGRQ